MGLGHATRSLPLIRALTLRGHNIVVGSSGRAMAFLRAELPDVQFVVIPDYGITYSRGRFLLPRLAARAPGMLWAIMLERELTQQVVYGRNIDLIISDHCYGAHFKGVPSYFISHQIYFAMPTGFGLFSKPVGWVNQLPHRNFQKVFIPDLPGEGQGVISGKLSRIPRRYHHKYRHIGLMASVGKEAVEEDIDLLVSISGPEPQRSILEEIVLRDIEAIEGEKVVLLGRSEESRLIRESTGLKIYSHLPREQMNTLLNRAKMILSRPGYTTVMELAELGKKALFIPTPGQTEQEYLAGRLRDQNQFYSVKQQKLILKEDLEKAGGFPGLLYEGETAKSVERIITELGL